MKLTHLFTTTAHLLMGLSLLLTTAACSGDDRTEELTVETPAATPMTDGQVMKMRLDGGITPFDAAEARTTRADWTWTTGNTIYLLFKAGTATVSGHATYSGSGEWEVTFNGSLSASGQCEVYYFEGATANNDFITLKTSTPVYADKSATYTVSNREVSVTAALKPFTSRLRLKGTSGLQATLGGVTTYAGYDVKTGTLTPSTADVALTVASTGYTPYVYCLFISSDRWLSLRNTTDGNNVSFEKTFDATVLRQGESGYLTIPTLSSNGGWMVNIHNLDFTVTGNGKTVSFSMVYVAPGTFQMGSTTGYDDEKPVHSVTLTKAYYMGETEVTQGLWYAVMGQSPTSDGSQWNSTNKTGDTRPAYYISYDDCQTFINSLNSKLSAQLGGMKFRMPTEAEWEFAARGGNSSKGYTYAGSNTIGNVAWCYENSGNLSSSNSAYGVHAVKTKAANELGIYDMSGNVGEWCSDWYGSYSSAAQTNPTGASTGSNRVWRGGGWSYYSTYCRAANRGDSTPTTRNYSCGLRLALQ